MDKFNATPGIAKTTLVLGILAWLVGFNTTSVSSTNGISKCSRTEFGAFGFGALAVIVGIWAFVTVAQHYKSARLELPLNVGRWTLDQTTFRLGLAMIVIGMASGAYRVMWAVSVSNDCVRIGR